MTSVERLILSKFAAAANTLNRGNPGVGSAWTQMMNWPRKGLRGKNKNAPIGPAAIGAPKLPPTGLTQRARPGLQM
jgi:hypothetical protein